MKSYRQRQMVWLRHLQKMRLVGGRRRALRLQLTSRLCRLALAWRAPSSPSRHELCLQTCKAPGRWHRCADLSALNKPLPGLTCPLLHGFQFGVLAMLREIACNPPIRHWHAIHFES
jgi:hypothetical protein